MNELTITDNSGNPVIGLTQWDTGIILIVKNLNVDSAPTFHFCNEKSTEALVVSSNFSSDGDVVVKVPNSLLTISSPIMMYVYVYSTNIGALGTVYTARTLYATKIPVRKRVKPSEYEYVENIDVVSLSVVEAEISQCLKTSDAAKGLMLDSTGKILYLKKSNGTKIGNGVVLPTSNEDINAFRYTLTTFVSYLFSTPPRYLANGVAFPDDGDTFTLYYPLEDYTPSKGDRLIVWANNALLNTVENYTIEEIVNTEGEKQWKLIINLSVDNGNKPNIYIQIWNIPTGSTPTYGTAYTNISSLTTDSISGTIEESD